MVRPTARVLALLEILQSGGVWTTADLAGRLDVDTRTVRRYVAHLLELDVPVESVRGTYGGYRLMPGYRMPPLMLTGDEALAVLLGLLAGPEPTGSPTTGLATRTAAAKVRRVLPRHLAARVDALLEVADLSPGQTAPPDEAQLLLLAAEATRDRRPLRVEHTREGRVRQRTVQPYGLVAHRGRWYLCGADSRSGEVRTFRLDRVDRLQLGDGTFDAPEHLDVRALVLASIAATPWRHQVTLRVHATTDDVRARLPPGLAVVDQAEEIGWVRVRMQVENLSWVPGVVVSLAADLDTDVAVEEPAELRARVRALARRLLDEAPTVDPPGGTSPEDPGPDRSVSHDDRLLRRARAPLPGDDS